jgi:release factor glutamine methyltransferase
MLARALRGQELAPGARVLDLCTGSGVLTVAAAQAGAGEVTAVDVSRRAVWTARINAWRHGVRVQALRGDLFAAVAGRRFDLIVSNPPYLPSPSDELPDRGPARAWEAGADGRALLDRICSQAPSHLRPGGSLLLMQSSVCGVEATEEKLRAAGLVVEVVARQAGPLGPLLSERAALLARRGLLPGGRHNEELVVVRATRPAQVPSPVG